MTAFNIEYRVLRRDGSQFPALHAIEPDRLEFVAGFHDHRGLVVITISASKNAANNYRIAPKLQAIDSNGLLWILG